MTHQPNYVIIKTGDMYESGKYILTNCTIKYSARGQVGVDDNQNNLVALLAEIT